MIEHRWVRGVCVVCGRHREDEGIRGCNPEARSSMIEVKRNVAFTQAFGAWFCLHVGSVAIYFGRRNAYARRLELFTPMHWLRWS